MKKSSRRRPVFVTLFWAVLLGALGVIAYERRLLDVSRLFRRKDPLLAQLSVLPRKAWGALPAKSKAPAMRAPTRVTVHHEASGAFQETDREATVRRIQGIQRYHQQTKGWGDIAYHFVVDRVGRIWEGRPLSETGAHAGSQAANERNIGILVLGNFDLQEPSRAQLESLRRLLEALARFRGIPKSRMLGHAEIRREFGLGPTNCPGKYLQSWLEEFRKR